MLILQVLKQGFLSGAVFMLCLSTGWAAPDFPPRDKGPVTAVLEQSQAEKDAPQETVTRQSAKSSPQRTYDLAEIQVTILSGNNQSGEKAYKTSYRIVEIVEGDKPKPTPTIKVLYKNKSDQNLFAVSKVTVKKSKAIANAYQITAEVIPAKPGEKTQPELIFSE